MSIAYIYGLECPVFRRIMYIGKSCKPRDRFLIHQGGNDGGWWCKKNRWINWLIKHGLRPELVIIEVCNQSNWKQREKHWIDYFSRHNPFLTNSAGNSARAGIQGKERDEAYLVWIKSKEPICAFKSEIFTHVDLPKIPQSIVDSLPDRIQLAQLQLTHTCHDLSE